MRPGLNSHPTAAFTRQELGQRASGKPILPPEGRVPGRPAGMRSWFVPRLMAALVVCASLIQGSAQSCAPAGMKQISDGVYRPLFRAITDPKEVRVKSFYLDVLPVTIADFLEFVRANPRWQRSQVKRLFADESYLKNWSADLDPGPDAPADVPVTYVSWFAAKAYAQWLGKRLPTVAEWEYVAAASPSRVDGNKDPAFQREVLNWYSSPAPRRLPPVGLGHTNCWGIQDLHGLVWEWVADFNSALVTGDARNDMGLDRQLFCGSGSVGAQDVDNFPAFMRYGFRSSLKAEYSIHNLGFRCAKDL